jgi:hypothetical protein
MMNALPQSTVGYSPLTETSAPFNETVAVPGVPSGVVSVPEPMDMIEASADARRRMSGFEQREGSVEPGGPSRHRS